MVVRIRLQRFGQKNRPFHRIVVADSRSPRDGRFIELLGTYDPIPDRVKAKSVRLDIDRFKYWITVGAQPSEAVATIAAKFNLFPALPVRADVKVKDTLPELRPRPVIPLIPALNEKPEAC